MWTVQVERERIRRHDAGEEGRRKLVGGEREVDATLPRERRSGSSRPGYEPTPRTHLRKGSVYIHGEGNLWGGGGGSADYGPTAGSPCCLGLSWVFLCRTRFRCGGMRNFAEGTLRVGSRTAACSLNVNTMPGKLRTMGPTNYLLCELLYKVERCISTPWTPLLICIGRGGIKLGWAICILGLSSFELFKACNVTEY